MDKEQIVSEIEELQFEASNLVSDIDSLISRIEEKIEDAKKEHESLDVNQVASRNFERGFIQGLLTSISIIKSEIGGD